MDLIDNKTNLIYLHLNHYYLHFKLKCLEYEIFLFKFTNYQ